MDRLADIRAKLCRAEEHLDTLEERLREWDQAEQPHGVDRDVDEGKRLYVFYYQQLKPFPAWAGILAGEAVHQMRSALDHLVARVIERQGGTVTNATAFPVEHTKRRWNSRVERRRQRWQLWRKKGGGPLKGIDPTSDAWAVIKAAQPYHRGKDAKADPLYDINDFWNRDKHRSVNAVYIVVTDPNALLDMFAIAPPVEPIERKAVPLKGGRLVHGAKIAVFRFPLDQPLPEMKVERPLPMEVRIGEPEKGDESLSFRDTLNQIRALVDQFENLV